MGKLRPFSALPNFHRQDGLESNLEALLKVYAVVVGALSAVTCAVYFIPALLRHSGVMGAAWNFVLFILWIALFGVFGSVCAITSVTRVAS